MAGAKRKPERRTPEGASAGADPSLDDSVIRRLSREELARLSMDSWEPSLLRRLLRGESKPRGR